jgi:hypothetical protein
VSPERRTSRVGSFVAVIAGVAAVTLIARKLGYKLGGNVMVRCRQGHLFTTLWIPGVKLKAIDLGVARVQHCPVGIHWSLVVPVRESDLTEDSDLTEQERQRARERHDARIA